MFGLLCLEGLGFKCRVLGLEGLEYLGFRALGLRVLGH